MYRDAYAWIQTFVPSCTDGPTLCPIVSAIHLEQSLQQDDMLYVVNDHVKSVQSDTVPNNAKLQSLLDKYKDRFPTELPDKLPPERHV